MSNWKHFYKLWSYYYNACLLPELKKLIVLFLTIIVFVYFNKPLEPNAFNLFVNIKTA